jgi:thiol:disulfide interchange protein DsbC
MNAARNGWAAAIVLCPLLLGAAAAGAPADPATVDALRATLAQRYPDIAVEGIQPGPLPGIYTVFVRGRVVYADRTGDYLFVGKLIDTRTRHDVAADLLNAHQPIDFHKLPFERAIKIVKGSGRRQLALFADPDCPYCRELEQELRSIDDVTVYVFLLPLEDLHPDAAAHARSIWCAPDRAAAWTGWMLERKPPAGSGCGEDPIAQIRALAGSLHVAGTPTMFLENGLRISSTLPAAQLTSLLDSASEAAAPTAGGQNGTGGPAAVAR